MACFTIEEIGHMLLEIKASQKEIKANIEYLKHKDERYEEEKKLTTSEVALILNKSERTIRNYIKNKNLPVVKPDGNKSHLIFIKKDIENWLKQNSL